MADGPWLPPCFLGPGWQFYGGEVNRNNKKTKGKNEKTERVLGIKGKMNMIILFMIPGMQSALFLNNEIIAQLATYSGVCITPKFFANCIFTFDGSYNAVAVAPGIRQVTNTFCEFNSVLNALVKYLI